MALVAVGSLATKENRGAGGAALVDGGSGGGDGAARGGGEEVLAWRNPKTGLWETPQPWNPLYREHKHTQRMLPRAAVSVASDD